MLIENLSIEDLILHLAGHKDINPNSEYPVLQSSDYNLINSFGKQLTKKVGFTDRQYELAKQKVDDYKESFSFLSNLEDIKEITSLPIREIDRARWINIDYSTGYPRIAVRFTFQKKLISAIEDLQRVYSSKSDYDKLNKIHYFEYSERTLYEIVKAFENNHFVLDDTVGKIYTKLCSFDSKDYVPGVYDFKIKNIHSSGIAFLTEELGEPCKDNILLYKDRSFKYGLSVVEHVPTDISQSLEYKIANRKHVNLISSPKHKLDDLFLALENLNRYPILLLLPAASCYDSLVEINQLLRNFIPSEQTSVVFRMDNQGEGIRFNEFIKKENLNNKVDKNTKVVYSLDNKIPKPLVNSDWSPQAILVCGASNFTGTRKVLGCYADKDLIIHISDTEGSGFPHYYRKEFDKL